MIYIWKTSHLINQEVTKSVHAGYPESIVKTTEFAEAYQKQPNKKVAVGYGILRGTADVFYTNAAAGLDFYEIDRGYINPKHFDGYYRISLNDMQAKYKDIDLPDDRLKRLSYAYKNLYNPKGHILVAPPTEAVECFYGLKPGLWQQAIVDTLGNCGRKVIVRKKTDTMPIQQALADAACVVTYNSNLALDATLARIPCVTDLHSIFSGWNANTLSHILEDKLEVPTEDKIDKLLRFMSYNQFTLEEFTKGLPWKILRQIKMCNV